jgi:glycosyltransferase involved in cell wall biosynthesis
VRRVTVGSISVVVPVRNGARYLGAAIDSILAQTEAPGRIVVVDDGSTDDTPAVIALYADHVESLRLPKGNASVALNRGIARAGGEHLAFLDADDLWVPQKLAWQARVLAEEPGTDAVFGQVQQFISPDAGPEVARFRCPSSPQTGPFRSAMLVRRAALERVGWFDERLNAAEFIDWYARALEHRLTVRTLDSVLVKRRIHGENHGIRQGATQRANCLEILKASLDRRRGLP